MNALLLAAVALGDKIESVGSYFGYAAVVGLGVLSLLYFAQAKEVKRLREWAGRSPERDADLAQRAQSDVQRRVVAQPAAPQPAAAPPGAPQTPAAQQADAARKAAAAAVMQKFQPPGAGGVPVVGAPGQLARPPVPGVPQPAGAPQPATAAAAPGAVTTTPANPEAGAPGAPPTPDAPATSVPPQQVPGVPATPGTSPGHGVLPGPATAGAVAAARQAALAGRSPASTNGGGHDPLDPPISRTPPDPPPRPARDVTASSDRGGRPGGRVGLIVGACFTVLVIAVAIVLLLSAGGDSPTAGNQIGDNPPPAASTPPPAAEPATKVDRRATQIAVLNGTFQNGLAASVAGKIEQKGFTILSKGTNADQQVATTTVSYAAGNKPAALLVAKIMGVSGSAVKASDANTATAAGPDADVVVIIGADVASTG